MHYIVYKITNIVNEKIYIGVHRTIDIDDNYFGSGVALKNAIKKHGINNFQKEVLFVFDNESEMFEKEKEIVNEEFVKRSDVYNLTIGGFGSWAHIDSSGENNPMHKSKGRSWKDNKSQQEIDDINKKRGSSGEKNGMFGKTHTDEVKQKLKEINSKTYEEKFGKEQAEIFKKVISKRFAGIPKTDEQKKKMSEAAKERWRKKKELILKVSLE
jgi:hypothetical protein